MAVTDAEYALKPNAPVIHDHLGTNRCFIYPVGNGKAADAFGECLCEGLPALADQPDHGIPVGGSRTGSRF